MMAQVFINGEKKEVPGSANLSQLLELLSLPAQRIAIELNREVVSRKDWETTAVNEGDRIEIVHFVGGG
jgi:thiamine biosynthesis protein ThiS